MSTLFHLFESLPFTSPQLNALKNIDMIITVEVSLTIKPELTKEEENVSRVINPALNPNSAQNLIFQNNTTNTLLRKSKQISDGNTTFNFGLKKVKTFTANRYVGYSSLRQRKAVTISSFVDRFQPLPVKITSVGIGEKYVRL